MSTTLVPYLHFNGECRAAMEFYRSVLGGDLVMQTFGETPMEWPAEHADQVIHASLTSDWLSIMASDTMPDQRVMIGDNIALSLVGSDEQTLRRCFEELAENGQIDMPLEKQFWGDVFGALTDRFGVRWMVNISSTDDG